MPKHKKQHYLPKFYLKGFSKEIKFKGNRQNVLWYYDKTSKTIGCKSVENLACESYYYSYKINNNQYDLSFEKLLSKNENEAAEILKKIENDIKIIIKNFNKTGKFKFQYRVLSDDDKKIVSKFIFYMLKRVPVFMDKLERDWRIEYEKLLIKKNHNFDNDEFQKWKMYFLKEIGVGDDYNFVNVFLKKNYELLYNNSDISSFITVDNPFMVENPVGNPGFAYPETNIIFPLSKKLLLRLFDFGKKEEVKKVYSQNHLFNINLALARYSYNLIFSDNEIYLKKILKKLSLDF